jgi:hypothetical protein
MMHFHVEVKMEHGCDQQSRAHPFRHESKKNLQYYPPRPPCNESGTNNQSDITTYLWKSAFEWYKAST